MTVVVIAVVAAAVGVVRGGSLDNLARTQFVWVPLLLVGLAVQLFFQLWSPEGLSDTGAVTVVLASYAAVVTFLVLNRRLPGMLLAGIGLALNVLVIAANGAMPVSERAVQKVGAESVREAGIKHEVMHDGTMFPFLGDVIPVPVVNRVLSPGDLVLAAGIGWFVYVRTRSTDEPVGRRRRGVRTASG